MSSCSCDSAIHRRRHLAVRGPPRRSRGSRRERPWWSRELLITGPGGPGGEALTGLAGRVEAAQHPFHVVRQFLGRGLEPAHLAAEAGAGAVAAVQAAAQVHLEAFDLPAV